ncbi:hypothetical protein BCR33DRAFT_712633 [Rhizoclosmatium globosum]|uniref:Centromere protein S n=1 Tax=Rhizoclosmatium globosum TaxID=329046 RepID=A0A1Y2CZ31_9FUNG|nr:Centromere protein S [Rhizoclosmatium sp. JEL0117]ORY51605.1 hypothetical protein BCR33DRAFT_712633 [Rhizoclosmatium globosum]|eukprot:ORY51605.1 hypothetical protein BCR33DRAFT_712633 [Rhizoclosmatium globosum]
MDTNEELDPPETEESLRLQASLHYSVNKIIKHILAENNSDATVTPQFVHAVATTVWHQCNSMAVDLDAFSKHGKRTQVNAEDVKLCVRRNQALVDHLSDFQASLKDEKPKRRK